MSENMDKDLEMNEEMEDNGSFITLTDDNGEDVSFEVLDLLEYKEREFVVLLPFEDTEDEVEALGVDVREIFAEYEIGDNVKIIEGTDEFISVEDEALLEEVFTEFLKRADDEE